MSWLCPAGMLPRPTGAQGRFSSSGNATVILSYAGCTILTDPNFLHRGDHVHLGYGMTAARRTDPALELEALPPIDFVLLSHMHEDHFDREVERKLDRGLPIVNHSPRGRRPDLQGLPRGQSAEHVRTPDRHQGRRSGPGPGDAWCARIRSYRQNATAGDGKPA
jgi:glyoxylase-like metal-dependent hydrolase (beta-lactamase superfamily II)